ncbi:MAG: NfeD family protein [Caldilineaceae bacterium]|nr:NfeD family protein [Caldilineaceae bacterium]
MNNVWMWGWAAMALIFMIAELFTAGFFLVCFGIGAAAAAIMALMGFDPIWQGLVFIVVSGIALLLTRPLARSLNERGVNTVGSDRVLNKEAIVLAEINPALGSGMVRVDAEEWRAVSADGRTIAKDTIVKIQRIDGTRLVVTPTAEKYLAEEAQ